MKDSIEYLEKNKYIRRELKSKCSSLGLVDAHRHSLYDLGKVDGMNGIPVKSWKKNINFTNYQRFTKTLFDCDLQKELEPWLKLSLTEGISTILDFSAKHAREDLKRIYDEFGIKSFQPIKWTEINDFLIGDLHLIPDFIILPDEKHLTPLILEQIIECKKIKPDIKFTLHCMESKDNKSLAYEKFGSSTVKWLFEHGVLSDDVYLVHVNEISAEDVELIKRTNAKVIICPLMRDQLGYSSPNIPLDLNIYFGTDAPMISGNRSLLDAAIIQINDWIEYGINMSDAVDVAVKCLTKKL